MERKLASVQRILDIQPIPNADAIEVLSILGWKVVAKKGEFKVGDLCVYCEVDSILPEEPEFEFLRKNNFRIKTIRLKGQVSQGIAFPFTILGSRIMMPHDPFVEGDDVTMEMKVTKYEVYVPAQLAGERKGNFPDFLSKTDEMRIQAVPELLFKHQNKPFYVTEKIDGSSMTAYIKDGEFGVCSRNFDMKETETNSFWKVARAIDLENKMRSLKRNFAFQGELFGPGVQGNKCKLDKLNFYIFNATDINTGLHFNYDELRKYTEFLDLTNVPLVDPAFILPATVDELVEYSKGHSSLNKDVHREGVVFRPLVNEYSEELRGRLSFKCINPDFLLKYNE